MTETTETIEFGAASAAIISQLHAQGVRRMVALLRHSAREYHRDRHDLENMLTADGRRYAANLGSALPGGLLVRGYASPPERCMETAACVLDAYAARGERVGRHRPVEGLGVFYALDQMRMWKAMTAQGADGSGMLQLLDDWCAGRTPPDMLIPAAQAASHVLGLIASKYAQQTADAQLDVCVSHDMTLFMVRQQWLGMAPGEHPVKYLDGLVFYREGDRPDGRPWVVSDTGERMAVDGWLA